MNSGTSSKRRYLYFVPLAHPGTFEIPPKDKNVQTKVGVSGFYEEIPSCKPQIPCRNSFSVCVTQKQMSSMDVYTYIKHLNLINCIDTFAKYPIGIVFVYCHFQCEYGNVDYRPFTEN